MHRRKLLGTVVGLDAVTDELRTDDMRWQFGGPPKGSANFARVQHSSTTSPRRAWPAPARKILSLYPTKACS